jgi:hypothetical protein
MGIIAFKKVGSENNVSFKISRLVYIDQADTFLDEKKRFH